MDLLTEEAVRVLVQPHASPCISIYQPTHRHYPDNRQDPIRFKNLIRTVEASLQRRYSGLDDLLAPLRALSTDEQFWNHTLDGLAVLSAPGFLRVFQFQRAVSELALVADSFHVKPLLRVVQSADRYHVLCITRHTAKMFEGNRDALGELALETFPSDIEAALGEERTQPHQTVASYGGAGGPGMHHGHGSRKDEIDKDVERYFRAVDRATMAHFPADGALPLVLVALPEHQPVFRAVSRNPALLDAGVDGDPGAMSIEQLRSAAWRAVQPRYLSRLATLSDTFTTALAHQKATADLADAARAAVDGRVSHLLVEADRVMPGRLDATTGAISEAPVDDPRVEDLFDDLAEAVLRTGGNVVMVPQERMPSTTGLAAIFRY
jgi:hypothetical protein